MAEDKVSALKNPQAMQTEQKVRGQYRKTFKVFPERKRNLFDLERVRHK